MEAVLKVLHELQDVDSKLDNIIQIRGNLPQKIEELETANKELDDKRQRFQDKHDELQSEISKAENEIIQNSDELKKDEENLYKVKNNKEYDALTIQIQTRKESITTNQTFIDEESDKLEQIKKHLDEFNEQLGEDQKVLDEYSTQLEEKVQETKKEETALNKKHDELKKKLEPMYYESYSNIRKSKKDAVVILHKNACRGCSSITPLQLQAEVRKMKKVVHCESCGRIIIPDFENEEE